MKLALIPASKIPRLTELILLMRIETDFKKLIQIACCERDYITSELFLTIVLSL